jgi:hypothetical protein
MPSDAEFCSYLLMVKTMWRVQPLRASAPSLTYLGIVIVVNMGYGLPASRTEICSLITALEPSDELGSLSLDSYESTVVEKWCCCNTKNAATSCV